MINILSTGYKLLAYEIVKTHWNGLKIGTKRALKSDHMYTNLRFKHEPLAREIWQPLLMLSALNKLYCIVNVMLEVHCG